jgi:hypothetical protein
MSRITNEIRSLICSELLNDRFKADEQKLEREHASIGALAYRIFLTKSQIDMIENKLPLGMVGHGPSIKIAIDGKAMCFNPTPPGNESQRVKVYLGMLRYDAVLSFNTREEYKGQRGELVKRALAYSEAVLDHDKNRSGMKTQINAVLGSVTTRAKLIEVWPEIETKLDRIWPGSKSAPTMTKALAVKMEELNVELGLPEKSTKKAKNKQ